ncbi:hypothetical protein PUNSTDRAFT_21900, partial [Punctularia strigosozonata HHB-11173 SS5]|uniref:uncharacterized protein n=1 Tax=Punctularia strigosozonata (strain HHB-11173) TaxID=741275 RepID=UPI000441799C
LPPEIWLHVFDYVSSLPSSSVAYEPFTCVSLHDYDAALDTRKNLVLVCKQWRNLLASALYADLRIRGRHDIADQLVKSLRGDQTPDGVCPGQRVRRAELPYSHSTTERYSHPTVEGAIEILQQCPCLETLVRPGIYERGVCSAVEELRYEFPAPIIPLPSLRRLEWWHNDEACRTGGINSLTATLRSAPNLEVLAIGGQMRYYCPNARESVELPKLTTMYLRNRTNAIFIREVCSWSLPAFSSLVVESCANDLGLELLWDQLGSSLKTVELGSNMCFFVADRITRMLECCESLVELNYYVFFTDHFVFGGSHPSITCIQLHAQKNTVLDIPDDMYWNHLGKHVSLLTRARFPELRSVVLHGREW